MKKLIFLLLFPVLALAGDRIKDAISTGTFTHSGTGDFTINGGGAFKFNFGTMAATFNAAESTPSSGGVAAKELLLTVGGSFSNCLTIKNPQNDGYGGFAIRDNSNAEKMVMSHGNPGTGNLWANINYIENWAGDAVSLPPVFTITADGNYGPLTSTGTVKIYRRLNLLWNSTNLASEWNIPHLIPFNDAADGADQRTAIQFATAQTTIKTTALPWIKIISGEGDCSFQFWDKQESALNKVISIGNTAPTGVGITGDFHIGAFNVSGGGWRDILRLNNDGLQLSFGNSVVGKPALRVNSAALQARLGDNSAYTGFASLYDQYGSGTPASVVSAPVGTVWHRTDGAAGTALYVKEVGSGNTGWVQAVTLPGSTGITTLGTITTGTWTGTAIASANIATALSGKTYEGLTITSTSGTLTIASGKTLAMSNSLTFTGTDGSTLAIGTGGTLGTAAYTASTAYQPIDADLTSIAALTTTAAGRGLLTLASVTDLNNIAGNSGTVSNNAVAYTVLSVTTPTVTATSTSTGSLTINGGTNTTRIKHGVATLVAGVVTVSDATVTANTRIFVQRTVEGGTFGTTTGYSITRSAGVSFTITGRVSAGTTANLDTSTLCWMMVEP